jgi:hypothetical protein
MVLNFFLPRTHFIAKQLDVDTLILLAKESVRKVM